MIFQKTRSRINSIIKELQYSTINMSHHHYNQFKDGSSAENMVQCNRNRCGYDAILSVKEGHMLMATRNPFAHEHPLWLTFCVVQVPLSKCTGAPSSMLWAGS
jgi:hypothetical protein